MALRHSRTGERFRGYARTALRLADERAHVVDAEVADDD